MTWIKLPIQDQWQNALDVNAAGYVFKTYLVGTPTPTPMAIDQNGATTVSTVTLNADGIPEVSGNEVTVYIDRDFRFAIYENSADAAADTNAFYGPVDVYNHIRDDDIIVVNDFTALTGKLTDSGVAIGSLIKTLSPDGFTYKKLQGIATDDGIRTITENRATTVATQYYGELTSEADDLPDYSTDGDYYTDTGASGAAYVLTLQTGRVPLKTLRNGARFRFEAGNTGTGGATTVDLSDALGQTAGTTVKNIKLDTGDDPPASYITGHVRLTYDSSSNICILEKLYRPLIDDEVQTSNIIDAAVTTSKIADSSVTNAKLQPPTAGTTYAICQMVGATPVVVSSIATYPDLTAMKSLQSEQHMCVTCLVAGTITITLEHFTTSGGSFVRAVKNGSLVQEWTTTSSSAVARSIDVSVALGDNIAIQHRSGASSDSSLQNVLINSNNPSFAVA